MKTRFQLLYPVFTPVAVFAFFLLSAFQDQRILPAEIQELEAEMEYYKENFVIDSALYFAEKAKLACERAGFKDKAIEFINHKFILLTMEDEMDLEGYLTAIESEWKPTLSTNPLFLQYYYGAKCTYFLLVGEVDSTDFYYQKTEEKTLKTQKWKDFIEIVVFAAQVYFESGDFFAAQDYIQKAEKIIGNQLLPKGEDFKIFYAIHSVIAQKMGDFEAALKSALKSVEYLRQDSLVDPMDLAYEYNNLGAIYNAMEDYANAEKYYLQALDLSKESKSTDEIVTSLLNLSLVFQNKSEYLISLEYGKKSLMLLNTVEENKSRVENRINCIQRISLSYLFLEELDSANYYMQKAKKLHDKTNYRLDNTLAILGDVYFKQKQPNKAIEMFNQKLKINVQSYGNKHFNVSDTYQNLGYVYSSIGGFEEALLCFQKALVSNCLNFSEVNDWHKNPNVNSVIDKSLMLKILSRKTKALQALHERKEAEVTLEDIYATALLSTEVLGELNKKVMNEAAKRFWLNKEAVPVYEQAIGLALQLAEKTGKEEYIDQAFQLSERSKSVLLTESLQETSAGAFGGVPDTLIQRKQSLERLIGNTEKKKFDALLQKNEELAKQFEQKAFQLEHELEVLKRELEVNYPKYYKLKYEDKVADLASIKEQLDDNTVFIEYFEGFEKVFAFVLRKNKASYFSVPITRDFQKGVMNYQTQLADVATAVHEPGKSFNRYVAKAHQLYEQLLAPAMKEVKENERIVIITDGTLGYIPFESLLTEKIDPLPNENDVASYANLPYVLHKYRVSYNYSGTLWMSQLAQGTEVINGEILAMAPVYGKSATVDSAVSQERSAKEMALRENLTELPGAAAEIDLLQSKYAGAFYKGLDASEKQIKEKAGNYGILHLAMHGLVDEKTPEFSSLAMTEDGTPTEDNFFYAYEIKQLNLKAGLVVLSACETGAGKYQRGEGVVSIGRGFMYAGAPSLIMTLWSLNDQSALRLIEYFYDNLAAGMEKDEALRQAKIKYLSNAEGIAAHPGLWACFVQLGNYSSIKINPKESFPLVWVLGGVGMIFGVGFAVQRTFKKQVE